MSEAEDRRAPMGALTALRPSAERTRRTQVLEAADRLVVRNGPQKTTVADIAREAGVAVGSVYLEFAGKAEILGALTGWRLEGILDAMVAALSPEPASAAHARREPAERICDALEARTRAYLDLINDGQNAESLLHCGCEGVAGAWQRFQAATEAVLSRAIAVMFAAEVGTAAAPTPSANARAQAILRAYAAFTPPSLCHMAPDALREALAATRALLQDGLRPR